MSWKTRFENARGTLNSDEKICETNRRLFEEFFDFEEYKLKRQNRLTNLDESSYKTLYGYVIRFRNVNKWFGNKPWKNLTKPDIKRVYDDLEDGVIKNVKGLPFGDLPGYYNKIFKSKPFRLAGKSELAKDVIEFSTGTGDREVRYVTEDTFRKMVSVVSNPLHLLLFWLAWDVGENVDALLKLTKRDFIRQSNKQTQEGEYLVNFPKAKIKRSRRSRTEPTLYPETVRYADMVLAERNTDDKLFDFEYRQALKVMHAVVKKSGATCLPNGDRVSWKDLRSGMACHLLKSGWMREEVDARLGHTPQSKALNAYINYLAIDRERPKKRLFDSSLEEIQNKFEEAQRREKLTTERLQRQQLETDSLKVQIGQVLELLGEQQELARGLTKIQKQIQKRAI